MIFWCWRCCLRMRKLLVEIKKKCIDFSKKTQRCLINSNLLIITDIMASYKFAKNFSVFKFLG